MPPPLVVGNLLHTARSLLILERQAKEMPTPEDWCYVFNFEADHRPRLLRLPAGRGSELQRDMETLLADLGTALGSAFEGEEYQTRRQSLEEGLP